MTITMRPARSSASISATELSGAAGGDALALPARGRTFDMRGNESGWVREYTRPPAAAREPLAGSGAPPPCRTFSQR
jgi:hypothetical protein